MRPEARVRVLRTLADLEEIRHEWESWPGKRDSDLGFYLDVVLSIPGVVRPHVLVAYRSGRPDAIMVGRLDRSSIDLRVGYLHFRPRARVLYFVYGAVRGNCSAENGRLFIDEILESLDRGEADAAYLSFLRTDADIYRLARTRPDLLSRDHICPTQPHFSATMPGNMEDFCRGLSPKVRKNQRWQAKRFVSEFSGDVRVDCYRELQDVEKAVEIVERVAKTSYQRGLGVGFVDTSEIRNRLRFKAEKGWLRVYVLYVEGRPCAYWIGDINQQTFGSDYLGYDPALAKHSPGMYLIMKVMESLCSGSEKAVTEVDFGPGHAQYKEILANHEWIEGSVYVFARSWKGISLNLARLLTVGVDLAIKRALAGTELLPRIKKTWRARASRKRIAEA